MSQQAELVTPGRRLTQLAQEKPNETALIVERQNGGADTLTRLQMEDWANRLAHRFAEAGVKQKSFVAINLPNVLEHVVGTLAAYKLGACPMPVSYRMPAAERDQLMALAEPAVVLSDAPDLKGITRAQMRALESYTCKRSRSHQPEIACLHVRSVPLRFCAIPTHMGLLKAY